MNKRTITLEHNGETYAGEIMKICETSLGYEDRGIATFFLHCEGNGGGIGVGGTCLDTNAKHAPEGTPDLGRGEEARIGTAYGLDAVLQVLDTAGARTWEGLPGRHIVVLYKGTAGWGGMSVGFSNLNDPDKVLIFKDHADQWINKEDKP